MHKLLKPWCDKCGGYIPEWWRRNRRHAGFAGALAGTMKCKCCVETVYKLTPCDPSYSVLYVDNDLSLLVGDVVELSGQDGLCYTVSQETGTPVQTVAVVDSHSNCGGCCPQHCGECDNDKRVKSATVTLTGLVLCECNTAGVGSGSIEWFVDINGVYVFNFSESGDGDCEQTILIPNVAQSTRYPSTEDCTGTPGTVSTVRGVLLRCSIGISQWSFSATIEPSGGFNVGTSLFTGTTFALEGSHGGDCTLGGTINNGNTDCVSASSAAHSGTAVIVPVEADC